MHSDYWEQRLAVVMTHPDRAAAVSAELAVVGAYVRRLAELVGSDPVDDPAGEAPVEVTHVVLGTAPCAGGWVGVLLEPGAPRPRVLVASTLDGLVEMVRESVEPAVVAVGRGGPEVDALATGHPGLRVERPEPAPFATVADLTAAGLPAPAVLSGRGYEETDVLGACAAAVEVLRPPR